MRLAWKIALGIVGLALLVMGVRHAFSYTHTTAADTSIHKAIALLQKDPVAWRADTQDAVRAAAVYAENNRITTAEAFYVQALQQQRESNTPAAGAFFREAIAADPRWSWPYAALGSLLGRDDSDRRKESVDLLRQAIALDPDWARPHNSLAVVLRLEGNYAEAEKEALRAIELAPEDIAAHNNYANLLVAMGRLEEAEKHYQQALTLDPEHPKPYYNLACLFSREGRPEEAIEMLAAAIRRSATLRNDAASDPDLEALREREDFKALIYEGRMPAPAIRPTEPAILEGSAAS